ncbi:glycosyltransferase [Lactococcus formosensis]|uniref:glycosyltransferase n=1 Tax=Lactococcus formosensis TaxID=1281486 RepID=UPI00288DBC00|nr:glycosyltransferase [Lactococcus formosensis]MDT2726700.1 glycosyltransferase [Lactococcus formosensis]
MNIVSIHTWLGNAGGITTAALLRTNELALIDKDENHNYEFKTLGFQLDYYEQVENVKRRINNLTQGGVRLNFRNPFYEERKTTTTKHLTDFVNEYLNSYSNHGKIEKVFSKDSAIRYYLETSEGRRMHLVTITSDPRTVYLWEPFIGKVVRKLEANKSGSVVIVTERDTLQDLPVGRKFLREDGTVIFRSLYDEAGENEKFLYKNQLFDTYLDIMIQLDKDDSDNEIIFLDSNTVPVNIFKKNGKDYCKLFVVKHLADYVWWKDELYGIPDKEYLRKEHEVIYEFAQSESNVEIISLTEMNKKFIINTYPKLSGKVHTIGNLIPTTSIEDIEKYPRDSNNFAFVGRLDNSSKRFTLALESFAKVIQKNNEAKMHFIGKFNDQKNEVLFKSYIDRLNLKNNIAIHGYTNNINKKLLDLRIDTVIMPSKSETFALVVPETLQLGIKFLAVDTPYWHGLWTNIEGFEVARISENPEDKINILANSWLKISQSELSRQEIIDSFKEEWTKRNYVQKYLELINA